MEKKYMVVGWGYKKGTDDPYSRCAEVVEDYKSGSYAFVNDKNCIFLDYHEQLGTIITATTTIKK